MRALIVMTLLSTTASAEQLRMHLVESENLHMADQRGAINWRSELMLTVDLAAKQHVDVLSRGSNNEHNLWTDGRNSDDAATWTTTWSGTWKQSGDTLTLELGLVKNDCKATRDETGQPQVVRTCAVAAPKVTMTCTTEEVDVEIHDKPVKTVAWSCGGTDVGETPSRWLLGKKRCIETHPSHHGGDTYHPC